MPKANISTLIALALSIFGLSSCSPDNVASSPEKFRLSAPVFKRTNNETISWNEMRAKQEKVLDLDDSMELASPPSGALKVMLTCQKGESIWTSQRNMPLRGFYKIADLLDDKTLVQAGPKQLVACAFDFTAISANNSTHKFALENVKITDNDANPDILLKNIETKSVDQPEEIFWLERKSFVADSREHFQQLSMNCSEQDFKFDVPPYRSSLSFEHLILDQTQILSPVQVCRLIHHSDESRVGYSNSFRFHFGNLELKTSIIYSTPEPRVPTMPWLDDVRGQRMQVYATVVLENPNSAPIQIRYPSQLEDLHVQMRDRKHSYSYQGKFLVKPAGVGTIAAGEKLSIILRPKLKSLSPSGCVQEVVIGGLKNFEVEQLSTLQDEVFVDRKHSFDLTRPMVAKAGEQWTSAESCGN